MNSDNSFSVLPLITLVLIILVLTIVNLFTLAVLIDYKQEAFERGFMFQCVGKSGYYWECDSE